jgi:hypothetical protein
MTHHRYHLELVALKGWPSNGETIPPDVRLRAALKGLLRRHGLRCVEARAIEPNATRTERNTDPPEGKGRCRGPPRRVPSGGADSLPVVPWQNSCQNRTRISNYSRSCEMERNRPQGERGRPGAER